MAMMKEQQQHHDLEEGMKDQEEKQQTAFSLDQQKQGEEEHLPLIEDDHASLGPTSSPNSSRMVVAALVVVSIIVASTLSYFAYKFARDQEMNEFEAKFMDFSDEIIRSSLNNFRNSHLVLESFSRTVTSLSLFANTTWPFITLPHYETRSFDYITISKAESITFAPVVPTSLREKYENYTVYNQGWIQEGIDYEYFVSLTEEDELDKEEETEEAPGVHVHVSNMEGFSILNKAKPIQPFVWTHAPWTHRAVPDTSNGPYVPIWQTYPAPRNRYVVNNNLMSEPAFEKLILASKDNHMTTMSDIFDNNFVLFGNAQTIDVDPKSVLMQPIFNHMEQSRHDHSVGYMIVIKKWHQIFQDVLYNGAKPIVVVLRNSGGPESGCQNKEFTYKVVGSTAWFLGAGDLHDTRYDSFQATSPLFQPNEISSACNYTLHVYPTQEMQEDYMTSLPGYIVLTVLAFCGLLALGFYLYDRMTKQHQTNRLKAQAQQEQALLRIEHARQAAAAERQLNEFIAHEVRNPLSAAMSACSFVSSAVQDLTALAEAVPQQEQQLAPPAPPAAPKPLFSLTPKPAPLFSLTPTPPEVTGPSLPVTLAQEEKPTPLFQLATVTTAAPPATETATQTSTELQKRSEQIQEQKESIMEDLHIIDSSLQFINELLRNMLDVQRAAHHQLKIEKAPTDVLRDILEPVDAMLYRRGKSEVEVILECPQDMLVMTDRLRLKQVVLNLSRNSAKFVEKGYIKLKVVVPEKTKHVQIWIEDSGPGIPEEKKGKLFAKFQESLDSLSQGTGLGLSLCKILIGLLGGDVRLDENFDSGLEGRPGARFIIDLQTPPLQIDDMTDNGTGDETTATASEMEAPISSTEEENEIINTSNPEAPHGMIGKQQLGPNPSQNSRSLPAGQQALALPQDLKVLFVDDDTVLRKLFVRALRRIAPGWKTQEAASGEACLRLIDELEDGSTHFDVIFMDQYMASTEKQLLGTEATQALRSKGVKSKICGLSANDMAGDFFAAGASAFICKPLPAQQDTLREVLSELLSHSSASEQAPIGSKGKSSLVFFPTDNISND